MSYEKYSNVSFEYVSPAAISHLINHNQNTLTPDVIVIDDVSNSVIGPDEILIIDSNNVQITFFVARAIRGKVQ